MIVRDVLNDPEQQFDFFNDYKDTINWLSRMIIVGDDQETDQAFDAIRILKRRYAEWHIEWMKK